MVVDLNSVEECGECGEMMPKNENPFCNKCMLYASIMMVWTGYLYQRWGILPSGD